MGSPSTAQRLAVGLLCVATIVLCLHAAAIGGLS